MVNQHCSIVNMVHMAYMVMMVNKVQLLSKIHMIKMVNIINRVNMFTTLNLMKIVNMAIQNGPHGQEGLLWKWLKLSKWSKLPIL